MLAFIYDTVNTKSSLGFSTIFKKVHRILRPKYLRIAVLSKSPLVSWIHKIVGIYKRSGGGQERKVTSFLKVTQWIGGRDGSRPMNCSYCVLYNPNFFPGTLFRVPTSWFWDTQAIDRERYHSPLTTQRVPTKIQAPVLGAAEGKVRNTWPVCVCVGGGGNQAHRLEGETTWKAISHSIRYDYHVMYIHTTYIILVCYYYHMQYYILYKLYYVYSIQYGRVQVLVRTFTISRKGEVLWGHSWLAILSMGVKARGKAELWTWEVCQSTVYCAPSDTSWLVFVSEGCHSKSP